MAAGVGGGGTHQPEVSGSSQVLSQQARQCDRHTQRPMMRRDSSAFPTGRECEVRFRTCLSSLASLDVEYKGLHCVYTLYTVYSRICVYTLDFHTIL
eukprot:scaffold25881_cov129-Isochrysis_galbana.AAC.1